MNGGIIHKTMPFQKPKVRPRLCKALDRNETNSGPHKLNQQPRREGEMRCPV